MIWHRQFVHVEKSFYTDYDKKHRKISSINRTKSENLSDCRLVLQLSLANPLKPGIKLRMKT